MDPASISGSDMSVGPAAQYLSCCGVAKQLAGLLAGGLRGVGAISVLDALLPEETLARVLLAGRRGTGGGAAGELDDGHLLLDAALVATALDLEGATIAPLLVP